MLDRVALERAAAVVGPRADADGLTAAAVQLDVVDNDVEQSLGRRGFELVAVRMWTDEG